MTYPSALVTSRASSHRKLKGSYLLFSFLLHFPLLLIIYQASDLVGANLQSVARLAIVICIGLYIHISFIYQEKYWSAPSLTFLLLSLFHLGLFITPAISGALPEFVEIAASSGRWFNTTTTITATFYVLLGLTAYSAGLTLALVKMSNYGLYERKGHVKNLEETIRSEIYAKVGVTLLITSILVWLVISITYSGPFFFLESYGSYLASAATHPLLGYANIGIAYGLFLSMFSIEKKQYAIIFFFFGLYSVCSLLLGMRDNALIPTVVAAIIWAKIRYTKRSWLLIIGILTILSLANVIRQLRATGLTGFNFSEAAISPLTAVEEMGFTLRVLYTTIVWHEVNLEPYYNGVTYWAPLARALEGIFGLRDNVGGADFRLLNVEVAERVGQIGGSMIAEAHHNFGILGIVLIMLMLGLLLGSLNARAVNSDGIALLGVVSVIFMMHIRNSFAPIPFWFIVGIIILILSRKIAEKAINEVAKT